MLIRCECGWEKDVDEAMKGKKARCPKCKETMIIVPYGPIATAADSVKQMAGKAISVIGSLIPIRKVEDEESESPTAIRENLFVDPLIEKLVGDSQNRSVVESIVNRVKEILTTGEEIECLAVQGKPMVVCQDAAVVTNKRFIVYRPKLLGRVDFEDYLWRELKDAKLSENIIGSTITFMVANGMKLDLDYLPRDLARKIYRIAQMREQDAFEERRNRRMEEDRAKAGGVTIQTAINTTPQTGSTADPMAKLSQLKQMLDAGLIDQSEYAKKKADILASM